MARDPDLHQWKWKIPQSEQNGIFIIMHCIVYILGVSLSNRRTHVFLLPVTFAYLVVMQGLLVTITWCLCHGACVNAETKYGRLRQLGRHWRRRSTGIFSKKRCVWIKPFNLLKQRHAADIYVTVLADKHMQCINYYWKQLSSYIWLYLRSAVLPFNCFPD